MIDYGLGGLLMAWPPGEEPPKTVALVKDGVAVDTVALSRLSADSMPVANLVDPERFAPFIGFATPVGDLADGARIGTARIVAEGDATPYCVRPEGGGGTVAWDLTVPLALGGWRPVPNTAYTFELDIGQLRCGAGLVLEWLRADGAPVSRDDAWREHGRSSELTEYETLGVKSYCPANATGLRVTLVQGAPSSSPDGFLFFREPRLFQGDPGRRPLIYARDGLLDGAPELYRLAPVTDALRVFGPPLSLFDGEAQAPVPVRRELGPLLGFCLSMTVDGRALVLKGRSADGSPADRSVAVVVDGSLVASGRVGTHGDDYGGHVELPEDLLDGGRHQVDVMDEATGETLATGIVEMPALQTPGDAIQAYTSLVDDPGLLAFSPERYRGFAATMKRLGSMDAPSWMFAEVAAAHAAVIQGPNARVAEYPRRRMPLDERPRFSIIIPVHNKFHFTNFCLGAVLMTTAGQSVEVIVVDDGSKDDTLDLEAIWEGVRVVRRKTAGGFIRACTAGADVARGEFLIFLNNDTEPMGRWLEELHLPFGAFADVGLTGAKLVYPDGRLQEAGGIVWNNGRPWNLGWGENRAAPQWNYTRQADYLSGAAIMIPRGTWEEVGGFSAEFEPAYYEDTDLAFKVREAGLRTVYAAKSMVVHYEGVSSGTDLGQGMKRYQEINRPKFEDKWRHRFRGLGAYASDTAREKDRGVVGRALVLDYQPPRFDMDAGSLAISQEIRLLQSFGYKVSIAPRNMAHLGLYTETFERGGVEHLHAPFYSGLADVIARRAAEFDVIYIHRFQTATGLPALIRQHAPNARILLNCADLHFLRQLREARLLQSEDVYRAAVATRAEELAVFEQVDAVLTYSEVEKAVIESQLGLKAQVLLLPFVAGDTPPPTPLEEREHIGFIGSYDHPPNRDAVEWFTRECWPRLSDAFPDLRFRIAGSGFDKLDLIKDDDRIDVLGWVPDARVFTGSCRVMVAPLRVGAGVKGKVVDALASGTPNVLSAVAAEGLGLEERVSAAVADTPAEWLEEVSRLLSDDEAWEAMSLAGLEHVRLRHSFEAGRRRFREVLENAGLPLDPSPEPGAGALAPVVSYDVLSRMATGV